MNDGVDSRSTKQQKRRRRGTRRSSAISSEARNRSELGRPARAPVARHQPRPARDAPHAMERGGVVRGQNRVQEGARGAERDPARRLVQLAVSFRLVGWTTTASVDYGSGRPANGTPREAMPQCAATAPPKVHRLALADRASAECFLCQEKDRVGSNRPYMGGEM